MKVYLVSSGNYSDYMIHGVFSSMEKAGEFQTKYRNILVESRRGYAKDFNDIEERVLDFGLKIPPGLKQWDVRIGWESGDCTAWECDSIPIEPTGCSAYDPGSDHRGTHYEGRAEMVIFARTKEHAIKIASDRRRAMLAALNTA